MNEEIEDKIVQVIHAKTYATDQVVGDIKKRLTRMNDTDHDKLIRMEQRMDDLKITVEEGFKQAKLDTNELKVLMTSFIKQHTELHKEEAEKIEQTKANKWVETSFSWFLYCVAGGFVVTLGGVIIYFIRLGK